MPSHVCVFPGGFVYFVKVKRDTDSPLSSLQRDFFRKMHELEMYQCAVLYGKEEVNDWLLFVCDHVAKKSCREKSNKGTPHSLWPPQS